MNQAVIDLNADLGESFGSWTMGNDAALLDVVTSANVACGFHAGDPSVLLHTCQLAAERGVVVGAHVAYRDLAGFGRRFIDVDPDELYADVLYQIAAIQGVGRVAGASVRYVKPHGALYNAIVQHRGQADAVLRACADSGLPLLGLPGSVALQLAADYGVRTYVEAFADRGYRSDGTLVPRNQPGALLHEPEVIADRMVQLVSTGSLLAVDGATVQIRPDSLCVHGDSPDAVATARAVRAGLERTDVHMAPFTQ